MLILRELIGGPRRYADLRAALPGIATNLLADRLRELEDAGLVDRSELPPPAARTVYTLSEAGWRTVLPVIKAVATFGLDLLEPDESAITALNGFLAGILLGFDPAQTADLAASYRIQIDDRRFEFGVANVTLTAAKESPAVKVDMPVSEASGSPATYCVSGKVACPWMRSWQWPQTTSSTLLGREGVVA